MLARISNSHDGSCALIERTDKELSGTFNMLSKHAMQLSICIIRRARKVRTKYRPKHALVRYTFRASEPPFVSFRYYIVSVAVPYTPNRTPVRASITPESPMAQ